MIELASFLRQSFDEYVNFVKMLSDFVFDQADYNLDFDCIFDLESQKVISDFISSYNKKMLTYNYLDEKFNIVQNKIVSLIQEFKLQKKNQPIEKYKIYKKISTLHNFLQATLENSIISQQVIQTLKDEYKENFLTNLQKLDAQVQSQITPNLEVAKTTQIQITKNAKLYLCLKKWKDILHKHYNLEITPIKKVITSKTKSLFAKNLPGFTGTIQELFILATLSQNDLISVEHIAKFVHIKYYNFLTALYGGKNLGLAILFSNGIRIPTTYCVSVIATQKTEINLCGLDSSLKYAIRSSATVEDNQSQSFAGMFDSVLDVNYIDIKQAIKSVINSINSPRVQEYVKHFNTDKPQMAVVVQVFKNADFAGVWLGTDMNSGFLEWTEGVGDKLVSGKVIPHSEKWDTKIPQDCLCVNNIPVAKECLRVQDLVRVECDLEFCIKDNQLFFLQCRPITKKIEQTEIKSTIDNSNSIIGIPASKGIATGKPVYIENPKDNNFKKGQIMLVDFTEPEWLPLILKASAIISAEGGMLSHTSIIARELGLPCVVGIGYENMEKIKNVESITIDGTQGIIKIN